MRSSSRVTPITLVYINSTIFPKCFPQNALQECSLILVVTINYRAITPAEESLTESRTRGMCPIISVSQW